YHKHPEEPAQQEGTNAALPAVVPDTKEKRKQQPRDHNRPVIAILPYHDRIAAQTNLVLRRAIGSCVEEPTTVAVPESLGGIVGVLFLIRLGVMADMVGAPLEGGVLHRPTTGDENADFDPVRAVETLMRHQSM